MKLQVLVNHFKEDETTVHQFLQSLDTQTGIDFEVLIASDGGGVWLTKDILQKYHFPIQYAYLPHVGVCHTRNVLMDRATADYIMFCDIDDMFAKPDGLSSLMAEAEKTQMDIISAPYESEIKTPEGELIYHTIEKDAIRIHSKIFKRSFLVENNIRFPDEMEFSGDMAFSWLAFSLAKNFTWIENNFYVWKWNANSVTRKDAFFTVSAFDVTLKCYTWLAEDLKKRNRPDIYQLLIATLFGTIYVYSTHPYWTTTPIEAQQKANAAAAQCLSKYYNDYIILNEKLRKERYELMLEYVHGQEVCGKFEDMMDWITKRVRQSDILVIGYGIVGYNFAHEIQILSPDVYDKYKNIDTRPSNKKYKVAFICVDTPNTEDNVCDITEIKNAINENSAEIYVIKSTILPGTIEKLCQETNKNIIFSPEYYGSTQHCNNYKFDFTILGGEKNLCITVIQYLQKVYDARHTFHITDAKTAELVKYMENAYLATKVSFCSQFFNIAKELNINYEELRELFILDPRVNPSHTFIYENSPYWNSRCLNKDMAAFINTFKAPLLEDIVKFNENQKITK